MTSISVANLLLRVSIFLRDLVSVDVDHTEIINMKACCGKGRSGPIPWRINFCECHLVTVAALGTDELMLQNKRREFFETARRFPLGGIVQIGMMEHTTLADLAAICLKRFVSRGGEILVPTSVKLATCH